MSSVPPTSAQVLQFPRATGQKRSTGCHLVWSLASPLLPGLWAPSSGSFGGPHSLLGGTLPLAEFPKYLPTERDQLEDVKHTDPARGRGLILSLDLTLVLSGLYA